MIEVVPEPTDEELLAQLGLELEQQMADLTASDDLPAGVMQQWAEEELRRDRVEWQPRRELPDQALDEEEDGGDDAGEALEFRDIKGSMLGPCELDLSSMPRISFSWRVFPDIIVLTQMFVSTRDVVVDLRKPRTAISHQLFGALLPHNVEQPACMARCLHFEPSPLANLHV